MFFLREMFTIFLMIFVFYHSWDYVNSPLLVLFGSLSMYVAVKVFWRVKNG